MIVVIFELYPKNGKTEDYLNIAQEIKPELSKIAGFISIERFQSLANPDKILSLSFWEDEESVAQWRNLELHRNVQEIGKKSLFKNYRLRVASILRDYGMTEREQAPKDSLCEIKKTKTDDNISN